MPCDHLPIIETFYYFLGFLTYLNAELLNVCQVFFVAKKIYVFSSKLENSIIIYIWQYSCLFFYSAILISEKKKYHIFQTMIQDFKIADFSYHKSMANLLTRAKIKKTSYIVSAWS
jgi:hypothetical protein